MHSDLTTLCVGIDSTIHQAIALMEANQLGIALVVDSERKLLGTITDGDVRRGLLANFKLDQTVVTLLDLKKSTPFAQPVTAPQDADRSTWLAILKQHSILHLPLVDQNQRVVALVTMDEFVSADQPALQAVIVAGGPGDRLRPLTDDLPKPMLPVGGRPVMELIVEQLKDVGIKQIYVTVHHKSEKITDHFGNGHEFGVDMTYVIEDQPLGTVGGLGLMEAPQQTTLVINGDIITQVDFRAMHAFHQEHGADLTVAVQPYEIDVPYGVIEYDGASVLSLTEKPRVKFPVNAGIYVLEPSTFRFIPNGKRFDMTELIQRLLNEGRPVVAFPIREYWTDIGEPSNYEHAQKHVGHWMSSP